MKVYRLIPFFSFINTIKSTRFYIFPVVLLIAIFSFSCKKQKVTGPEIILISFSASSMDFGDVTIGESSDQTLTITNSSSSSSTLSGSISLSGTGFSIVSGEGSFSLSPGFARTVTIKFSPTSETSYSGTVTISHNATSQSSPTNVSLSGNGQKNIIINMSLSRNSINFGTVTVGQTKDESFTISNSSISLETLTGSVGVSGAGFSIISGGGSFSLSPGQSRTVTVKFSPTSETSYSGTVTISHNATNQSSPASVSLSGSGGTSSSILISLGGSSINFGAVTVGQTKDGSFNISNSSSATGALAGTISISGAGFSIVSGGGSFSLSPGQSRTVTVRFSPTSETSYSGTVTISHNATNQSSPAQVSLSGSGQENIIINMSLSRSSIPFGTVTVSQTKDESFSISNSSSATGALAGTISISGAGFSIVSGGGSFSLSPGQSRTVTVRFSPTSETSYSGTVTISHNATNQSSPASVSLSGSGQENIIINMSLSCSSIPFGTVTVSQTKDESFTISNSSISLETLTGSVGVSGAGFSIVSGGGSFSLSPGQSRTVTVRFSPTSETSYSGTVTISHNATNQSSPAQVSLSGSGGQPDDIINMSLSRSSINFGTVTVGQTKDETFIIVNSSSSNADLNYQVSCSGPPFSIETSGGPQTIAPNTSRNVVVRFSPTSNTSYSGTVSITHNATNQSSPTTVSLSGIGDPAFVFLSAAMDAYVAADIPEANFGSEPGLAIGNPSQLLTYIAFDLSQIPTGATIQEAILRFYPITLVDNGMAIFFRAQSDWMESTITWNTKPGWELPYVTSTPPGMFQWWEIDVKLIVTEWITNGAVNRGFYIEGVSGVIQVHSRESSSSGFRPQLYIQYILD